MCAKIHPQPVEVKSASGVCSEPELNSRNREVRALLPSALLRSVHGHGLGRLQLAALSLCEKASGTLEEVDLDEGKGRGTEGGSKRRDTIFMFETARKSGLRTDFDLASDYDTLDKMQQLDVIRRLPVSLAMKKKLKNKLMAEMPEMADACLQAFIYRQKLRYIRWKIRLTIKWRELITTMTLWQGTFKAVEGYFGCGVLSYFRLLKQLFQLNIFIFLLILLFIIIPQMVFPSKEYSSTVNGPYVVSAVNLSLHCSSLYDISVSDDALQVIADLLQGTGWMEKTAMFYGYYSDREMQISGTAFRYNMPLAYLLITAAYYVISLFVMIRMATAVIRLRQFAAQNSLRQWCNKVFASWDYSMSDKRNSMVLRRTIFRDFQGSVEEYRRLYRRQNRSWSAKCSIFAVRALITTAILTLLGGGGYAIYYTTVTTAQDAADYSDKDPVTQLLIEYLPSLVITGLNAVLPVIFKIMVKLEDYTPGKEVNITLLRYTVPTGDTFSCWETKIGQELYKLVIIDFMAAIGITFFVEFPRRIIVTNCNAKLFKAIGQQEFDIPKNLLDLIYHQVLLWLGAFFAPMLVLATIIKSWILFYVKMMTVMLNCRPSSKPYRASDSAAFFMLLLILTYILCGIPIFYFVWYVSPSRGCGPFRYYGKMYDAVLETVDTWPSWIGEILAVSASTAIFIPAFIALALVIYYYKRLISGYQQMIRLLRDQLTAEGTDKQFLLRRLRESQKVGEGVSGDE